MDKEAVLKLGNLTNNIQTNAFYQCPKLEIIEFKFKY